MNEEPRESSGLSAESLETTLAVTEAERKVKRLEQLAKATGEMMGNLDAVSLPDRLAIIARRAAEILEAETSAVFQVEGDHLVLAATFGHRSNVDLSTALKLKIHDEVGGGLTGYIAYHRKLFKGHGQSLKTHPAVAHAEPHMPSADCYSLLAIPLLKHTGQGKVLIGLLRVDNKKGEGGKVLASLGFSQEDEWILSIFAEAAVVAIQSAQLFEQAQRARRAAEVVARVTLLEDRQNTLLSIAQEIRNALSGDVVVLFKYSPETGSLVLPPAMVGARDPGADPSDYPLVQEIMEHDTPYIVEDVSTDVRFVKSRFALSEELQSCVAIPLKAAGRKVGAMFICYRNQRRFMTDELANMQLFANQSAVAIYNAQLFEDRLRQYEVSERKRAQLAALNRASKEITAGFGMERRQILEKIVQAAMEDIVGVHGPKAALGVIQLYYEERDELVLECVYPPEKQSELVVRIGERRPLRASLNRGARIGMTGRAVLTGEPQLAAVVTDHHDYIEYMLETRSELAVPLIDRDHHKIIGVLNVESDRVGAFDVEDVEALQTFAELAVVAIQNARRYEELKEARQLVDTRTTLAWMGIGNAVRRHEMANYVGMIRSDLFLLTRELKKLEIGDEKIHSALERIERMAGAAAKMDKSLSGRIDAQRKPIRVNAEMLRSWSRGFDGRRFEPPIQLQLRFDLDNDAKVRGNVFWLKRVLDILVNNAAEATEGMAQREIALGSRKKGSRAEVYVSDNGPGIPETVRQKLFREPVEKSKGSKGLGMGLLVAQSVVQIYGGNLTLEDGNGSGTTMVISLPLL